MSEAADAERIAWETVMRALQIAKLPTWILESAASHKTPLHDGQWKVEVYLFKRLERQPGESWEKTA